MYSMFECSAFRFIIIIYFLLNWLCAIKQVDLIANKLFKLPNAAIIVICRISELRVASLYFTYTHIWITEFLKKLQLFFWFETKTLSAQSPNELAPIQNHYYGLYKFHVPWGQFVTDIWLPIYFGIETNEHYIVIPNVKKCGPELSQNAINTVKRSISRFIIYKREVVLVEKTNVSERIVHWAATFQWVILNFSQSDQVM